MCNSLFQNKFHQFLCRRRHILIALPEGNHGKAQPFQILRHLHRAPAVEGDLADVVLCAQFFNKFLDIAVVDDVALRRVNEALPRP